MSWFRSFWQKVKKPLKIAGIILACLLGVAFIVSFIGGYFSNWTWTGFGPYTPPTSDFQRGVTLLTGCNSSLFRQRLPLVYCGSAIYSNGAISNLQNSVLRASKRQQRGVLKPSARLRKAISVKLH
ncbi:MAG TPA: hypothetical protein VEL49_00850 [Ktedonobacteraceae bacterium]|nr:hypothetical protein [Ktedonobacteraceae bacterium]